MSRSARLFLLMDALRGHRRPVAAAQLADTLAVSVRTIYRDIQTLMGLGAPIDGEPGIGYVLRTGFFLPPLMFNTDELEALVLGARWVQRQGDAGLESAAASALAKIATASIKDLRDTLADTGLWTPPNFAAVVPTVDLRVLRESIRYEHKLQLTYSDEAGTDSERVIWPIALAFFETKRALVAWCELRAGFRLFRVDRMRAVQALDQRYATRRAVLVKAWRRERKIPEHH